MNTQADTENILTPLLNREGQFPADGWLHLISLGDHPITVKAGGGGVRRILQRLDAKACEAIVADFRNRQASDPSHRVLIDYDHFSWSSDKSSEAAGWITALQNRDTGVWFQAEWSDEGEKAVKNKRYRYPSPVWLPEHCETIDAGTFRPLRLRDVGLTNKPNLQGLVPFWNRAGNEPATTDNPDTTEQPAMNTKAIALALGLPETADEAAIIAAIGKLTEGAAQTAPLQNRLSTLEAAHKALLGDAVAKELVLNQDVIPEGQKDAWKNRLESDFTGTAELLRGLKRPEVETKNPVHQPGKGKAASADNPVGEADVTAFANRITETMKTLSLSRGQALVHLAATDPDAHAAWEDALRNRA